jgi:rubrerythrin
MKEKKMLFSKQLPALAMLDITSRRSFGKLTLMAGVSTLGGNVSSVFGSDKSQEIAILNTALGLEHQAIAVYQAGAETKLLSAEVLKVAVKFQGQHKQHRDVLTATIRKLGSRAVDAQNKYDVAEIAKSLKIKELATEKDIIMLAQKLEAQATSAYLNALTSLENKDLLKAAAAIMADEAIHSALLLQAVGSDPVPKAFVS